MKKAKVPYKQRAMKILKAETAQEAETIVNGLYLEAVLSGSGEDLPDVQVTPGADGYTIIIFNDFTVSE